MVVDTSIKIMEIEQNIPVLNVLLCRPVTRPCLLGGRVILVQEGYSTCLVNALLGITRLPGTTFLVFPPSCVTSNLDDLNGIIQFLHT